jgi:hypothetical protein
MRLAEERLAIQMQAQGIDLTESGAVKGDALAHPSAYRIDSYPNLLRNTRGW